MTLTDLIAAIEAAPQEDRSLDWEIWRQIIPAHYVSALDTPPHYTRSVDAALTLVPKGWRTINACEIMGKWRWVLRHSSNPAVASQSFAATPALALCAATLRARTP